SRMNPRLPRLRLLSEDLRKLFTGGRTRRRTPSLLHRFHATQQSIAVGPESAHRAGKPPEPTESPPLPSRLQPPSAQTGTRKPDHFVPLLTQTPAPNAVAPRRTPPTFRSEPAPPPAGATPPVPALPLRQWPRSAHQETAPQTLPNS